MKGFWVGICILAVLIVGYQFMRFENKPNIVSHIQRTGMVYRYLSDELGVAFDYVDNEYTGSISLVESGSILMMGSEQKIKKIAKDPSQSLYDFVYGLLSTMDKTCVFAFETGTFIPNSGIQQLIVRYTGLTGEQEDLCDSSYIASVGHPRFLLSSPERPRAVYLFDVGVKEHIFADLGTDNPRYTSLKILPKDPLAGTGVEGSGEDIRAHLALIHDYYAAIQDRDFVRASSFVASGEISVLRLQSNYSNVLELQPFMIQHVGENTYHYFVRYIDTGYIDYRKEQKTYSIKKSIVDGKLHGISNDEVVANTELAMLKYYKDEFITYTTGSFVFADLFSAQKMVDGRCAGRTPKDVEYFKGLLAKAKEKGTDYYFTFTGSDLSGQVNGIGKGAHLYIYKNVFGYKNIGDYLDDFALCTQEQPLPVLINADYVVFLDVCKDVQEACLDMKGILKQSLRFK